MMVMLRLIGSTRAQPASSHTRNAPLRTGCGWISGSISAVSDGCHGWEPDRNADASHSRVAAMQMAQ